MKEVIATTAGNDEWISNKEVKDPEVHLTYQVIMY